MVCETRLAAPVAAMLMAAVLAGCVVVDDFNKTIEAISLEDPPAPRPKPARATPPKPRPKPLAALAAKTPATPAEAPEFDPETLVGLMPSEALAALGRPSKIQERSPSMVWRYDAEGCALDLFFYMDLGANAFRVLAYDMKATASQRAARACLGRLHAAANRP